MKLIDGRTETPQVYLYSYILIISVVLIGHESARGVFILRNPRDVINGSVKSLREEDALLIASRDYFYCGLRLPVAFPTFRNFQIDPSRLRLILF